ncbi:hypothetical protein MMC26_003183 [Xylographa opegraphella]|nr:hypothetical protein [Xylographa opegraphella]
MDPYQAILFKLAGMTTALVGVISSQIEQSLPAISADELLALERVDGSPVDLASDPRRRKCQIGNQCRDFQDRLKTLNDTVSGQINALNNFIPTSTENFNAAAGSAFNCLQALTAKMLQVADGDKKLDLEEHDLGLTLTSTRGSFQALVQTCQDVYKQLSDQAAALAQQESYNDRLKLDIQAKNQEIKAEQPGVLDMVRVDVQTASQLESDANTTRDQLSSAQNDANSIGESLKVFFTGSDNDLNNRIQSIEDTLRNQEDARNQAREQAINHYQLYVGETTAISVLDDFLAQVQTNFNMASNEYDDLMGSRGAADRTFESIKLLCWDIENSQDSATRDACLKHVLHLLNGLSPPLDQVAAVVAAKQEIEAQIKGVLGDGKFEKLKTAQEPPAVDM